MTHGTPPPRRIVFGPTAKEPVPAFRYIIDIDNERVGAFLDCRIPSLQWNVTEVKEGGLNDYTHQLIGQRKRATLTLKRGVAVTNHLFKWYTDTMQMHVVRKQVTVALLDQSLNVVMQWIIEDTFPTGWQGPRLAPQARAIAIGTLTLSCGRITVQLGPHYK